jgi:YHS domain-containing protein
MDRRDESAPGGILTDPVCGSRIDPGKHAERYRYEDHTYYFCSPRCAARFRAEPGAFLHRAPA